MKAQGNFQTSYYDDDIMDIDPYMGVEENCNYEDGIVVTNVSFNFVAFLKAHFI